MKALTSYLDELKEKTGSDNKTAIALGVERSTIANIRRRNLMSDETAIKIAHLLEIDESEVLIAAAVARSQGEVKKAWEKISKWTATLSVLLFAFLLTSYSPVADAAELTNNNHYAKLFISLLEPFFVARKKDSPSNQTKFYS